MRQWDQAVNGFSLCLTFRLSTGPEESPSKATQKLYDLITFYCRMYLQRDSCRKFCLRSCAQSCNIFVYKYIYIVLLLFFDHDFIIFVLLPCSSYFVPGSVGCTHLLVALLFTPSLLFGFHLPFKLLQLEGFECFILVFFSIRVMQYGT